MADQQAYSEYFREVDERNRPHPDTMKGHIAFLQEENQHLSSQLAARDAELLRVRTIGHGAAHQLDNLAVELGFGAALPADEIASKIRTKLAASQAENARLRGALDRIGRQTSCMGGRLLQSVIDSVRDIARAALNGGET